MLFCHKHHLLVTSQLSSKLQSIVHSFHQLQHHPYPSQFSSIDFVEHCTFYEKPIFSLINSYLVIQTVYRITYRLFSFITIENLHFVEAVPSLQFQMMSSQLFHHFFFDGISPRFAAKKRMSLQSMNSTCFIQILLQNFCFTFFISGFGITCKAFPTRFTTAFSSILKNH